VIGLFPMKKDMLSKSESVIVSCTVTSAPKKNKLASSYMDLKRQESGFHVYIC
jgi:hypothetical protein